MTIRETLRAAAARLTAAGVPDPKCDAEWLLEAVTGRSVLLLRLNGAEALPPAQADAFEVLLRRRAAREPLQYLLGNTPFCGRLFRTDARALIPRPETELLAERAAAALRACGKDAPRALDLCCGSGCLGVTLALEVPQAAVFACDLSPDALCLARENAGALGARVTFAQGDLFAAWPAGDRWDLIVSNPPYIPSADCPGLQAEVLREPLLALDGGADGLDFYRRIAAQAPARLHPGGILLMEVGDGEAGAVCALLKSAGLREAAAHPDLQGILRMVEART